MTRAVVLGGGGVTGIAWEVGVLTGLIEGGIDLDVDAVFGTSAGSFVGVALASGAGTAALFAAQDEPAPSERNVRLPRSAYLGWVWAYLRGGKDAERIGRGFGALARRRRPLHTAEERRQVIEARLVTSSWPTTLHVTAIDARSGQLHAFTAGDGCSLIDAVTASGAVPGISPAVTINGRSWIDGGMVSSANAHLATGYDEILVIAPLPVGHGGMPSVEDDVTALRKHSQVDLLVPDERSRQAIGPNIYDATRRAPVATAGRLQGVAAAAAGIWRR